MSMISYKCPNCGGGLIFDPATQKLKCEYCNSEFSEAELDEIEKHRLKPEESLEGYTPDANIPGGKAGAAVPNIDAQAPKMRPQGRAADGPEAVVYTCPSCGAEIVTTDTTAATFCYYCHNPVVLEGRLSGDYLPDYVIPFELDRAKATNVFLAWIKKKKFVPHEFFSEDQIEKFTGVYFPYLMYSCEVDGKLTGNAEKTSRTWVAGNIQYTEHQKFQIDREGTLDVKNVMRNALSTANSELIERVLPYDMDKLKPFTTAYLSGFQAEKRDMEPNSFEDDVEKEVKDYTLENLKSSVTGYQSIDVTDSETKIRDPKWTYALLPVWIMTYNDRDRDKMYYFAMNGQTGKIAGKLPTDKKKLALLFAVVFLPIFIFFMIVGWFI